MKFNKVNTLRLHILMKMI